MIFVCIKILLFSWVAIYKSIYLFWYRNITKKKRTMKQQIITNNIKFKVNIVDFDVMCVYVLFFFVALLIYFLFVLFQYLEQQPNIHTHIAPEKDQRFILGVKCISVLLFWFVFFGIKENRKKWVWGFFCFCTPHNRGDVKVVEQ